MLLHNIVKSYLSSKKNKINLGDFKNNLNNNEIIGLTNSIFFEIKKKAKNIKKKQILIAIYLPRNVWYLSSIFATWLSGNYFVPLNQNWPKKYLESVLKDCDPFLIISNKNLNIKKYKNKIIKIKKFKKITKKQKLLIENPKKIKNKISYLIYTSGSSGDKKGVIISEKNLISYMKWVKLKFKSKKFKSILITGELSFDILIGDLSNALMFKTSIYLTPDTRNTLKTMYMIKTKKIEAIYGVPSTLKNLFLYASSRGDKLKSLKIIFSGGDVINANLFKMVRKVCPQASFINMYGPTEITVNCLSMDLSKIKFKNKKNFIIPTGKEFAHLDYKLIDPVSLKIKKNSGELIVGGSQLMPGYLNDKNINSITFINIRNKKYYRTGDIFEKKKEIYYFLNRFDKLNKYKGFRINTLTIDNILQTLDFVKDAKTLVYKDNNKEVLTSFVSVIKKINKDNNIEKNILQKIQKELPKHNVPDKLIILNDLYYNDRGKYNIPKFNKILKRTIK
jgi:D-alanine--poly(phosphoribitol) ligase subunit 1